MYNTLVSQPDSIPDWEIHVTAYWLLAGVLASYTSSWFELVHWLDRTD